MKKFLFAWLSITAIILAGCTDSDRIKINSENWASDDWSSIEQVFNVQIEETQYIHDLEDFLSYDILLNTQWIPYISTISLNADFDKNSSIQWWLDFSWKNILKSPDLESIDIKYNLETQQNQDNVETQQSQDNVEPFYSSWDITLLYQDEEMYANLHSFWLFMGEENMTAKMYTLLWDTIKDKWINLDVNNGWIITVNKDWNTRIQYIVWTLKNVLNSTRINEDSPNFVNGVAELIDVANLWISTDELTLITHEISYYELPNQSIQKEFTGSFQWRYSTFDLHFTVSKNWLDVHLYNIKEYDEDIQNYKDTDSEFLLSLEESKKSEYSVVYQSIKSQQNIINLEWKLKYSNAVDLSLNFELTPSETMISQKISWKLKWEMKKEKLDTNEDFPELSWEIVSFNEIAASL